MLRGVVRSVKSSAFSVAFFSQFSFLPLTHRFLHLHARQTRGRWTPPRQSSCEFTTRDSPLKSRKRYRPPPPHTCPQYCATPELLPYHPNAMQALGMSGHPGSYEILSGYSIDLTGEVSRPTYQAMAARQIAMGHLGRRDSRAVLWLTKKLRDTNPDPEFTFRALKGARLARELRGQAAAAVALSGSERARNTLLQLRSERRARTTHTTTGLSIASLDAALEDLDRIREYGPERALALPFPSTTPRNPSAR